MKTLGTRQSLISYLKKWVLAFDYSEEGYLRDCLQYAAVDIETLEERVVSLEKFNLNSKEVRHEEAV